MKIKSPVKSSRSVMRNGRMRSKAGTIKSLHTMVESAMVATITMLVLAESPPT